MHIRYQMTPNCLTRCTCLTTLQVFVACPVVVVVICGLCAGHLLYVCVCAPPCRCALEPGVPSYVGTCCCAARDQVAGRERRLSGMQHVTSWALPGRARCRTLRKRRCPITCASDPRRKTVIAKSGERRQRRAPLAPATHRTQPAEHGDMQAGALGGGHAGGARRAVARSSICYIKDQAVHHHAAAGQLDARPMTCMSSELHFCTIVLHAACVACGEGVRATTQHGAHHA